MDDALKYPSNFSCVYGMDIIDPLSPECFNSSHMDNCENEWVNIFEYFDHDDLATKLYAKYKFRPLSRVKMKVNHKLELHVVDTVTEIFLTIVVHDDAGPDVIDKV